MAGINRVTPYHPPEVRRGPFIFPKLGSTNSNSPTRNPASLVGNFGRTRATNLGKGPANPYDLLRNVTGRLVGGNRSVVAKVKNVSPGSSAAPAPVPRRGVVVLSSLQRLFGGGLIK